jgi:rhodanese-related sulfurtransferase
MPTDIARADVQRLQANGGQVVEVLPHEEYAKEHLPSAISLPLEDMRRATVEAALSRDRPVVVYCQDDE